MPTNADISAGLDDARAMFEEGYTEVFREGAMPGMYLNWTEEVDAPTGRLERHWITNLPVSRQWVGARVEGHPRHYNWVVKPVSWENTLRLPRRDFTQDRIGVVTKAINGWLSGEAGAHDKTVADKLDSNTGAGPTGYDGVALFSTAHPHVASGAGASNLGSGTNLSHANYAAARAVGMLLTGEQGEPLDITYNAMRVGPNLEQRAKEITGANMVVKFYNMTAEETTSAVQDAPVIDNVNRGEVTLYVDRRVGSTYYWDLFDLSHGSDRPMVIGIERNFESWEQTDMNSPDRVDFDEFVWGHDGEWVAEAGNWLLAYRGTGTA